MPLPLLRRILLAVSFLLILPLPALAQFGNEPKVKVTVKPSRPSVSPGDQAVIAVILDHAPGWHTHTNAPVVPKELGDLQPYATEIDIVAISGARAGPIQWPKSHEVPVAGSGGKQVLYAVFDGHAVAYIPLIIDANSSGEVSLTIGVGYQACDKSVCLMFVEATDPESQFKVSIPISAAAPIPPTDSDFASFDPAVFAAMQEGATPAPAPGPTTPDHPAPNNPTTPIPAPPDHSFLGFIHVPAADSAAGLAVIALLAAVGGLVLNLTPCVLPVIPIKIMTISHHAGTPGKALYLGLAMAAGVVTFWTGLGLIAVLVLGVTDPSIIFGIWWVTFTIGLLIGVMALGLMGLFTFSLPQSVYMLNPRADNAWGSFLFGVMTAVLGLPCFGFVAGALLAGSATLPARVTLIIFAALGVGMASPYLVLSAFPKLVDKIPRTGPASELVKQVMGLLLLAAAFFFSIIGLQILIADQPHLSKVIQWWAVGFASAAAGLWLTYRTLRIASRPIPKVVFAVIGLVIAVLGIAVAISFDRSERARFARAAAANNGTTTDTGPWARYTPARLEAARHANSIIVVDFTADWCLNCLTLKATVLDSAPVQAAIAAPDVVTLTADLSSRQDPGWAFLKELGQVGIPLLVVFAPGSETPDFGANAYTPDMVVQAIEKARAASRLTSAIPPPPAR